MSCNEYGWYSPSGWICNGANALVRGLIGGTDQEIEKVFNSMADRIFSSFNQQHFGAEAGKWFNEGIKDFFKNLDLEKSSFFVTEEFKKAVQAAIKSANFAETSQMAGDEFEASFKIFRKSFFTEINGLSSDIQDVFANAARDTTLKMLPWIAAGIVMLSAAPLITYYAYLHAKHNIGKPKLANKVHYAGYVDGAIARISSITSSVYHSAISGVKWAALSGFVAYGGFIPTLILCETEILPACRDWRYKTDFPDTYLYAANTLPLVIGASAMAYSVGSKSFLSLKNWFATPKEARPIFSPELQAQIQEITSATYNLKRNGGFFQNLLLYGPGGTGKTMVAEQIARKSNMNWVMMSGGDLAQYIKRGEHVTELNKLFQSIENSSTPTILFIDEIESLGRNREKLDKAELFELLNAFLSHTGKESKKFMLIGATNRPQDLDPALLSRLDHKLEIGLPQANERKKILQQYIQRFFSKSEQTQFFSDSVIKKMAQETDGLTGRAIFKMLNALSCKKMATKKKTLDADMIHSVVQQFVSQEKRIAVLQEE